MLRISGLAGLGNKMMKTLSLLIVLTILAGIAFPADRDTAKPQTLLLWPDGAPGAKGDSEDDKPTITAFIPPANSVASKAVVIFPGGGYGKLSMENEGAKVANWLNSFGVAAFVVSYRHSGKGYRYPAPLDDAQRAMRLVRSNAAGYNIDPDGIGVLGFSAGGHLASTVATLHGNKFGISDSAADPVNKESSRPNFAILCYPVISMTRQYTHQGSKRNLLGRDPDPKLVKLMSTESQVTKDTPPTFLFHSNDDTAVPPENSIAFYTALRKAKVPAVLHIFETGKHGFGLGRQDCSTNQWPDLCKTWILSL